MYRPPSAEPSADAERVRQLITLATRGIALIYGAMLDGADLQALQHYCDDAGTALAREYDTVMFCARTLIDDGLDPLAVARDCTWEVLGDLDAEIVRLCGGRRAS